MKGTPTLAALGIAIVDWLNAPREAMPRSASSSCSDGLP